MKYNLIVILGPTASGKTKLAVRLAIDIGSEIISADSRQVYRGMDIGTGKDLAEYIIGETAIPYHLINIVDPEYEFNVFEYQRHFAHCFNDISSRSLIPIMVGGTGLYIESVIKGYRMLNVPENPRLREKLENEDMQKMVQRLLKKNPNVHNTTDLLDRKRLIRAIEITEYTELHKNDHKQLIPIIYPAVIGIKWDRSVLRQRITNRLNERLTSGMIEEVKRLNNSGIGWDKLHYFGLEYRYISLHLQGKIDYKDMFEKLNTSIHQFAKRQETWFRRMEKGGTEIHWINGDDYVSLKKIIDNVIKK